MKQKLNVMDTDLMRVGNLIAENKLDQAAGLLEQLHREGAPGAWHYFYEGEIAMKKEEWGQAINLFGQALEHDPGMHQAKARIDMARAILNFFNPDLLNP